MWIQLYRQNMVGLDIDGQRRGQETTANIKEPCYLHCAGWVVMREKQRALNEPITLRWPPFSNGYCTRVVRGDRRIRPWYCVWNDSSSPHGDSFFSNYKSLTGKLQFVSLSLWVTSRNREGFLCLRCQFPSMQLCTSCLYLFFFSTFTKNRYL